MNKPSRIKEANRPTGYDVWRWAEFQAFADRLGLDTEILPTTDLIIHLPLDDAIKIQQTYLADDFGGKDIKKPATIVEAALEQREARDNAAS